MRRQLCQVGQEYAILEPILQGDQCPNTLNLHHFDFERARLLTSKTADRDKAHSTSNAISPQQERTPSGPRPSSMARSCRSSVSLTYQAICYVVIQAKGLSFSTILGKISWVCPKGGATFLPARMMGWMAPERHLSAKMVIDETHHQREPSMSEITTIGLDLAKHVFQVHGVDANGAVVLRKQLRRGQVMAFFGALPRCLIGLEACATAHYWARELQVVGHEVRLMPAQYVKAYVKRNKNDAADAEAICEAVGRPSMRFVAIKTAEQQAALLLHRGRERLVRQRTGLVNALRAHLAEFGVIAPHGLRNVARLIDIVRDASDTRLPDLAHQVLQVLATQLEQLMAAVAAIERQLAAWHRSNPVSQHLASIPGIGPIIATALAATVV